MVCRFFTLHGLLERKTWQSNVNSNRGREGGEVGTFSWLTFRNASVHAKNHNCIGTAACTCYWHVRIWHRFQLVHSGLVQVHDVRPYVGASFWHILDPTYWPPHTRPTFLQDPTMRRSTKRMPKRWALGKEEALWGAVNVVIQDSVRVSVQEIKARLETIVLSFIG